VVLPDWTSGSDAASGTLVLGGIQDRTQTFSLLSATSAPPIVVTGTYPNTTLRECRVSCDVRPGATVGDIPSFQLARVSGAVLGDLIHGSGFNELHVGPADATTGTTATVGGSVELSNGDSLSLDVFADGTADRLQVTGAVSLSSLVYSALYFSAPEAFTGPAPSRLLLIDNAGTDPITGGFYSWPEGAEVNVGGVTYRLTYVGGDGNDLELVLSDTTNPTIVGSVSPPTPNGTNGWYRGSTGPTVSFACSDAGSGIATCSGPTTLGSSATAQAVTGTAVDVAGNQATATVSGLKVDLVAPAVACPAVTPSFAVGQSGSVSAAVSDAHSGPTSASVSTAVPTATPGSYTASLTGTDVAGNTTTVSCPYVVQKVATVLDAHPVLLKLTGGVTVTFPLSARLTTAAGAPVAGQAIRFSVGDRVLCTGTTDSTGWASCGGSGAWTLALLNGGFTATYAGNGTYQPSTDAAGLLG
jgi:hypothetical protein